MRTAIATALLGAALLAGGCGGSGEDATDELDVVATTAVAADLVRAVGGDRVRVTVLIPAGADPHAYEPRPDDLKALSGAKLIVRSGGEIDEWLDGAIQSAGADGAERLTLLDAAAGNEGAPPADAGAEAGHGGDVDPHWWHDPLAAVAAVEALEASLDAAAGGPAGDFAGEARAYRERIERLDRTIEACLGAIPTADRELVTSHDALGPFARRYGLNVVATVIPSRSTQAKASSGAIAEVIDRIRRGRVKVVFPEDKVDPKVERALADEAGARVGPPLYADGLGPEGSPAATYLGMLGYNATAIAEALGAPACELP